MSGKTVKRVETTATFDPELRVNVRDQVEYFLDDDWPRVDGDRGVFRPTMARQSTYRMPSGQWVDHYFASGVYIKKDGTEGVKTHYEFDTAAVVDVVMEATGRVSEVAQ